MLTQPTVPLAVQLGVSEKTVLREFHKDAMDLHDVCQDLERVCKELQDPRIRAKRRVSGASIIVSKSLARGIRGACISGSLVREHDSGRLAEARALKMRMAGSLDLFFEEGRCSSAGRCWCHR